MDDGNCGVMTLAITDFSYGKFLGSLLFRGGDFIVYPTVRV